MIPVVNARWGRYLRKGLAALLDEADAVRVPPRAAPIDKPVPERGLTTLAEEPTKKDLRKVEQKISSKGTSIKQIPAVFKKPEIFDIDEGSVNLDIGGGRYDLGTDYLQKERGIENLVLDKFNRSSKHNEEVLSRIQKREGADSATVANVLNVIKEPEIRGEVIQQSYDNTREGGKVFFQIHQGSGKEAGKGAGRETSKGWQNYKKTSEYVPEIEKILERVMFREKEI